MQRNRVHEIVEVVGIGRIQNLGIQDDYAHRFEAGARSAVWRPSGLRARSRTGDQ